MKTKSDLCPDCECCTYLEDEYGPGEGCCVGHCHNYWFSTEVCQGYLKKLQVQEQEKYAPIAAYHGFESLAIMKKALGV